MKFIIFIVFFKADGWTDVTSVQVSHLSLISQLDTINISSADILGDNLLIRSLQPYVLSESECTSVQCVYTWVCLVLTNKESWTRFGFVSRFLHSNDIPQRIWFPPVFSELHIRLLDSKLQLIPLHYFFNGVYKCQM